MWPIFKCNFLTLYMDLWQNQGVFRIPHVLEIYLGIETSQFDEDWPKLRAKNWRQVESEIYMYILNNFHQVSTINFPLKTSISMVRLEAWVVLLVDLVPLQPDAGLAPLTAALHHPLKKWFVSINLPPDLPDGCLELLQGLEWTMLGDIHLDDGPDVLNGQQVGSVGGHSRRDSVRETPGDSLENVLSPVNHCLVILEQAVQVSGCFFHFVSGKSVRPGKCKQWCNSFTYHWACADRTVQDKDEKLTWLDLIYDVNFHFFSSSVFLL